MQTKALFAVAGVMALFSVAGCSQRTQEETGEAARSAGQDVERTAERAGQATERTAENAGQAVEGAAENAGEAVGGAVKGVAKETQDAAQAATLTPKVKNALVVDKTIDASTMDVDTDAENDTVIIKGTARSQAEKKRATEVAQRFLKQQGSTFKVRNDLTVGAAAGGAGTGGGATGTR
jgi:hypothetical protein